MIAHVARGGQSDRTVCGRRWPPARCVMFPGITPVTCKVCLRHLRARIARIVILEKRA